MKQRRYLIIWLMVGMLLALILFMPRPGKGNQPVLILYTSDVLLVESFQKGDSEQLKFAKIFFGYLRSSWQEVKDRYTSQGVSFKKHTFGLIERRDETSKRLRILISLNFTEKPGQERLILLKERWLSPCDVSMNSIEEDIERIIGVMLYFLEVLP